MGNRREVWWPESRRFFRVFGPVFVLFWLISALFDLVEGEWLTALPEAVGFLVGCFMLFDAARRRVETDDGGIQIVGLFNTRYVPWREVAAIRPEKGRGSSRLVVERRSGDVLPLPLNPTTHRALVARWREISAGMGTSEAD